jgi:hypothetical protein
MKDKAHKKKDFMMLPMILSKHISSILMIDQASSTRSATTSNLLNQLEEKLKDPSNYSLKSNRSRQRSNKSSFSLKIQE